MPLIQYDIPDADTEHFRVSPAAGSAIGGNGARLTIQTDILTNRREIKDAVEAILRRIMETDYPA